MFLMVMPLTCIGFEILVQNLLVDYEYYYTIVVIFLPSGKSIILVFGRPRFNPWLGLRLFFYSCNN